MSSFIIIVGTVLVYAWGLWKIWKNTGLITRIKVAASILVLGLFVEIYDVNFHPNIKISIGHFVVPFIVIMAIWLTIEAVLEYRRSNAAQIK